MYSRETSQREDRRVGLMTIASSVVAEYVASGTLGPGASPRISLRVSAGSLCFLRRSLTFLSFLLIVVPEALTARPAESSLMGLHKLGYGELGVCEL